MWRDLSAFLTVLLFALALCWPVLGGKVPAASDTLYLWAPWSRLPHPPVHNSVLADDSLLYLPWSAFERQSVADGEWPMWNPYTFAGAPFAANSQSQLYYPLTWLLWLLPLSGAIQALALFNICLAGWGMYIFCRELGVGRMGALIAGLAFCGSGMLQLALEVTVVASVYGWLPWMMASTARAIRLRSLRWAAAAGLICGLQAVAGHLQWALYSFLAVGCWVAWRALLTWREQAPGPAISDFLRGMVVLMTGLLLAAVHLSPFLEFSTLASRTGGIVSSHSWPAAYLLRLLLPQFFGSAVPGVGTPMVFSDLWYVGIPVLLLAVVAVALRAHNSVWLWLALAVFSLLVTYGVGPFLYVRWLPGLSSLLPMRIGYLFIFSMCVLGGLGFDAWLRFSREWPGRALLMLTFPAAGLAASLTVAFFIRASEPDAALRDLMTSQITRGVIFAVLSVTFLVVYVLQGLPAMANRLRLNSSVRHALVALPVVLLGCDLLTMAPDYNQFASPDKLIVAPPSAAWLNSHAREDRVLNLDTGGITFNSNTQMMLGLQSVDGYDSLHTVRYEDWWRLVDPSVQPVARGNPYANIFLRPQAYTSTVALLLNTRYIVSVGSLSSPGLTRVYTGDVNVYENSNALPRAFLAGQAEVLSTSQVKEHLVSPRFEPRNQILLEQSESPPELPLKAGATALGNAQITSYRRNSVAVLADVGTPSWLVLGDVNYPGWRATVDGRDQQVYTADYILRAVPLMPGKHDVVFTYTPTRFLPAALVSALTLVSIAVILLSGVPSVRIMLNRGLAKSPHRAESHSSLPSRR